MTAGVVGPRGRIVTIYTATYTLRDSDNGNTLCFASAGAVAVLIPLSLQIGWNVTVIQQGAGVVTFTGASGVTINNLFGQVATAGQWSVITLRSVSQDNYVIGGESPGSSGAVTPQYASPLTGATVVVNAATGPLSRLILTPAGTLATLTVDMASIAPGDGYVFELMTTQEITALTANGETFLLNANSGASWVYRASNTTWYARY